MRQPFRYTHRALVTEARQGLSTVKISGHTTHAQMLMKIIYQTELTDCYGLLSVAA